MDIQKSKRSGVTGKSHRRSPKKQQLAKRADRHALYERSVQAVDVDFEFIDRVFSKRRGRKATFLREDFCGTANMCCEWVRHRKQNRAVGVDLDPEVLRWGRENNIAGLKASAIERITLIQDNVLAVQTDPPDIVLAFNFSYQLFKDRKTLRQYFMHVREALADDGIFFLDAHSNLLCFSQKDTFTMKWYSREIWP